MIPTLEANPTHLILPDGETHPLPAGLDLDPHPGGYRRLYLDTRPLLLDTLLQFDTLTPSQAARLNLLALGRVHTRTAGWWLEYVALDRDTDRLYLVQHREPQATPYPVATMPVILLGKL